MQLLFGKQAFLTQISQNVLNSLHNRRPLINTIPDANYCKRTKFSAKSLCPIFNNSLQYKFNLIPELLLKQAKRISEKIIRVQNMYIFYVKSQSYNFITDS